MDKVTILQKIKWTVFLQVSNESLAVFTQCIEKLCQSVDPKRTEIIYLGEQSDIYVKTFSHFCEKSNISYNYADDTHHALELSKGQYIILLTDHTIVTNHFAVKLTYAMDNSDKENQKTAIVSPVSNEVAPDLNITPFNLDEIQANLSRQNIPYDYTMKLSLFCLMIKKTEFREALTVQELILHANYNGLITVSVNDCIVYHYPENIDETIDRSLINTYNKLGIIYRVKVDDEYIRDKFIESLEKTVALGFKVYVLDDNSKIKLGIFLKEKHPELWNKITKYEKFSRTFDERTDYNELMDWAEKDGCNWVFCLEADEVIEDRVNATYLERLINPPNPEVFGYKVSHYYFYNSETKWRVDAPWGKLADIRLFRLFPGKRITNLGVAIAKSGFAPSFPKNTIRDTSIRIKHYGFSKEEHRIQKKEFYDKLGIKSLNNFDFLLKDNGMHSYPWVENNTVTFYTPIKKGGDLLWRWLDIVGYFADEILIGNDSDNLTEEDKDLILSYNNAKIIPTIMGDNFAEGRNIIIKEATSKWIQQLDVDEQIEDIISLPRLLDFPGYDAWMFAIANIQHDGNAILSETMRLFKNKDGIKYWGRLHETIDNFVHSMGWKVSTSPLKMTHFGYTTQTPEDAYKKMQRYLGINMSQIKENPLHGMAYFNLALHFVEDDLIDDAIKMLELCTFLKSDFPLAKLELSKCYIIKANKWMDMALKGIGDGNPIKQSFLTMQNSLHQLMPKHYSVARGHCMSYFNTRAEDAKWLRDHMISMEKKVEEEKTKLLEKRAKGK